MLRVDLLKGEDRISVFYNNTLITTLSFGAAIRLSTHILVLLSNSEADYWVKWKD